MIPLNLDSVLLFQYNSKLAYYRSSQSEVSFILRVQNENQYGIYISIITMHHVREITNAFNQRLFFSLVCAFVSHVHCLAEKTLPAMQARPNDPRTLVISRGMVLLFVVYLLQVFVCAITWRSSLNYSNILHFESLSKLSWSSNTVLMAMKNVSKIIILHQ